MTAADLRNRQELFYRLIDQVEKDYYLYFGLKSIQKGLSYTESIYDHFKLSSETLGLSFNEDSDLPQEIRDLILNEYHGVFLNEKQIS
ncbi:hypothetical protein [Pedobacter cryoconitis]|uniref:Uncharacterized protein n=1 Tax=Pedobacter cryoconitis TaxID=188932 RepID=A0A7X0MJW5_9SPHI|nr:hypothetical protein [Pedobacter cryoconitis]MBB6500045.1 hypothetical protein [Pedobacter cryoconitis]